MGYGAPRVVFSKPSKKNPVVPTEQKITPIEEPVKEIAEVPEKAETSVEDIAIPTTFVKKTPDKDVNKYVKKKKTEEE